MKWNTIVFATGNKGKLKEAQEIFRTVEIVSIFDYASSFNPDEYGRTFLENAVIKAEAALQIVKEHPVLSDDSGLIVPALNGDPGIFSARYGGEEGNDVLNRKRLLHEMSGKTERSAFFLCTAMLLFPDYSALVTEGRCNGIIGHEECGTNGFGYDALFTADDFRQTVAELDATAKNTISHRGKAFRKLEHLFEKICS